MLNPNQSIPIGAKVEISPQWFYKAEIEKKKNFNLPQVTSKCSTLWPCIGPKAEKKKRITSWNLGSQFTTLGAQCSGILLIIFWHQCFRVLVFVTFISTNGMNIPKYSLIFFHNIFFNVGRNNAWNFQQKFFKLIILIISVRTGQGTLEDIVLSVWALFYYYETCCLIYASTI
jgi:hypothetical protein